MSRPSITTDAVSLISRCRFTSARLTAPTAATFDAAALTSGMRIASVTSLPFKRTVLVPLTNSIDASMANCSSRCMSSIGTPASSAHSPTARYIAPVSIYTKPSLSAKRRAMVLFPDPAGPSIATTIRLPNSQS